MPEHLHFITGKLAEHSLRSVVESLAASEEFTWSIQVMPISVAALMTPDWIARRIDVPEEADRVLLPGHCYGDVASIQEKTRAKVEVGPRDLRRLPEFFGRTARRDANYGEFDIEIIAEINHAPRLSQEQIVLGALALRDAGADVIDVGCDPGSDWTEVGEVVQELRDHGLRVSIDSLNPKEIAIAARAGAELVLSVNASNRDAAADWGVEVVAIPDAVEDLNSLRVTAEFLERRGVPCRLDPILSPIGAGFAQSLGRYLETRRMFPEAEMMMGVGNLTELTDADSAAVNVLLLGFCQETGIRSILTTQVIHWAQTSVRELDLARRLVKFAVDQGIPPKHLEPSLVILRGESATEYGDEQLRQMADDIKDANYRVFAERGRIHLLSRDLHLSHADPFDLFAQLLATNPSNVDASHAFYLGFEMAKARTALTLAKHYEQDNALNWGFLTVEEQHRRLTRSKPASEASQPPGDDQPKVQ